MWRKPSIINLLPFGAGGKGVFGLVLDGSFYRFTYYMGETIYRFSAWR